MRNFFKTVAIVTVFSICEKFLGFLYRIYLSRSIGSEGIGIYQIALSVFALLLTVCCAGTPITVSRLMTKYSAEGDSTKKSQIISSGIISAAIVTLITASALFIGKGALPLLFADSRCVTVFLIILPGMFFTSVYSVLRGVFWGDKDFLPYSVIELLEEICMIIVGVVLISRTDDVYLGTKYAAVAVCVSYVFSFSLALAVFFYRKHKLTNPLPQLRPLLSSSIPVTAMRTTNSLSVSLVSVIMPIRLAAAGLSNSQAMSLYGAAVGQAMPILFIPTTLIGSFILVLVPEISENYYKKQNVLLKNDVEKSLKFTAFLSCAFIPVFIVCGEEIGILIFGSYECGEYLSASAFLMVFTGLSTISTSILNSIGLEKKTLLYFVVSAALMLLAIWFLTGALKIYSLLLGYTLVYGVTTVLNLRLLSKKCPIKPTFIKPIIGSALLCLPTTLIGLMSEKLLLPVLGTSATFITISVFLIAFNLLLHVGFGLINVEAVTAKIRLNVFRKRKSLKN